MLTTVYKKLMSLWGYLLEKIVWPLVGLFVEYPVWATLGAFLVWCLYILILCLSGLHQNRVLILIGRCIGYVWLFGIILLLSNLWDIIKRTRKQKRHNKRSKQQKKLKGFVNKKQYNKK